MDMLLGRACWIDHSFVSPRMHQVAELKQQQHGMTMFPTEKVDIRTLEDATRMMVMHADDSDNGGGDR